MVFLFYPNFKLHSTGRLAFRRVCYAYLYCFRFILTVGPTAGYCFFRRAAADLDTNTMQTNKKRNYIRNGTHIWTPRQRQLLQQRLVADSITWSKRKSMLSALRYDKNNEKVSNSDDFSTECRVSIHRSILRCEGHSVQVHSLNFSYSIDCFNFIENRKKDKKK